MHRLLFLLSLLTLHSALFSAPPPQLLRATLVGDNQLAAAATLTAQSGSTTTFASGSSLTLASGATLTLPSASVPWAALTTTPTTLSGYGITDAYASPLTTAGDLLYGGTSGAATRLGIGATGQVLSVSAGGLPVWSAVSGTGTVTSITAGTGLTGGTITGSGTLGLDTSGVTAGSYGGATSVPVLTVDATGRITAASTATVAALANPMTSPGDLIYGGSLGTPTRLAIGTAGQVLKVNSGATGYEFGAATSGTGDVVGPSSATSGRLAVFSGTTGKIIADASNLTVSGTTVASSSGINLSPNSDSKVVLNADTICYSTGGGYSEGFNVFAQPNNPSVTGQGMNFHIGAIGTPPSANTLAGWFRITANGVFAFATYNGTSDKFGFQLDRDGTYFAVAANRYFSVASTTASTSPTTGALLVSGGAGIAGRTSTGSLAVSTTGTACDGLWSATATLDFGSIAAASQADLTITVTGASVGDSVALGLPASPTAGIVWDAWVSAADTVTIRASNITTAAIDPAGATYRATVSSF